MPKKLRTRPLASVLIIPLLIVAARAQNQNQKNSSQTCRGPIYSAKDVTHRARIVEGPNLNIVIKALGHDVHARVNVEAVLCRSGRVTDIRVIESLPSGITEFVIAAVSEIRFTPAEKNWHTASQRQRFEFLINDDSDIKKIDPSAAAGRLLERLEIIGNRRITAAQIRSWMKTQVGEPYNSDQIKQDLEAILATGFFDKTATRVYTEEGARSGVGVIFEVVELALISEVKFEGLKIDQSLVLEGLEKEQINFRTGAPFKVEQVKDALRVIKQVLESNGQRVSEVEIQIEHVTAATINVIFVITPE